MIKSIYVKYKFDTTSDRLGPDCPFTHWRLYLKPYQKKLCSQLFYNYGTNAEFRAGAYAVNCSKIFLGNNVIIRPLSMLFADPRGEGPNIIIEDNVMLGSGVHIYTANHTFSIPGVDFISQGHDIQKTVRISKGAWVGANTTILPGVTIAEHSVVGAGSVVTKDTVRNSLYLGSPARKIRDIL